MIQRRLQAHDAGVRHETVGWLHADDAVLRGGDADRAALVTADGEVDIAARNENSAPARAATGRVALGVDVADRSGRTRVAESPQGEVLADGLPQHRTASLEDTCDDTRIDVRRPVLDCVRANERGNSSNCDVVLMSAGSASEPCSFS